VCDGADNDCDGVSDNSSSDGTQFYPDGDGDGYGAGAGEYYCVAPYGSYAERGGDCEDFDPTINPGAGEVCDGIDNDCSGTTDRDAADATLLYEDLDQDGYGNDATAVRDCNPGESYTAQIGGDCDDNDPLIKECNTCGCQATPTAASGGVLAGLFTLLFGLRRRR
jgi:MYXO-CTERM domain-containing protein